MPATGLTLDPAANTLYGTTTFGGPGGVGTVFKINTSGSGYAPLWGFDGFDGGELRSPLLLSGDTLYGAAVFGGSGEGGTVFQLDVNTVDPSGFSVLKEFVFPFDPFDPPHPHGAAPLGALALHGGALFGLTSSGGANDAGVLYKIELPGSPGGAPAITGVSAPAAGSYKAGDELSFAVTFDAAVTVTGVPRIPLTIGATARNAAYASGTGTTTLTFTVTVQAGDSDTDGVATTPSIDLNAGTIKSAGGVDATLTFTPPDTSGVLVDGVAPAVESLAITSATGIRNDLLNAGDVVSVTVTMSEPTTVVGTPKLTLDIGGAPVEATYASGSPGDALVFTYTILAGQTDDDGIAIEADSLAAAGGTLADSAGNPATLAHPQVDPNPSYKVDTTAPAVDAIVQVDSDPTNADSLAFTASFSEAVSGVGSSDFAVTATGTATGSISGFSGSGSSFTVTVGGVSGDGTLRLDLVDSGTGITDPAGNPIGAGFTGGEAYTVDNTPPTISIGPPSVSSTTTGPATYTVTYADANFNASTLAADDVTLNKTDTAVGRVEVTGSGTTYTVTVDSITGAGTMGISIAAGTASDLAGNQAPAAGPSTTFTVDKADQTITFDPPGAKTFGDEPFPLSATGGMSGEPVTFSIQDGPATVSGGTVTLTGAGTVTVRASQAGNANYNPAPDVDRSFAVAMADQAITFAAPGDKTFGDEPFPLSATGGMSGEQVTFSIQDGPATVSGGTVTLTGAGTVTVRASQAGNANYKPAPDVDRSFAVAMADQVITFAAPHYKLLGDDPFDLMATGGDSGEPVVFSIVSGTENASLSGTENATVTLAADKLGEFVIRASQAGSAEYHAAPDVEQCITVVRFTKLVDFTGTGGAAPGSTPHGRLTLGEDGNFLGLTDSGGAQGKGVVFQVTTGGAFTKLWDFTGTNGANPTGHLVRDADGNLWGMTSAGGTHDLGTLFVITESGVQTAVHFDGDTFGQFPLGSLVLDDGKLYGLTQQGGIHGGGTAFRLDTTMIIGGFAKLHDFEAGAFPRGDLVKHSDGDFYGTTSGGGGNSMGSIFRMTSGGTLTTAFSFDGAAHGSAPFGSLIVDGSGNLLGMSHTGGALGPGNGNGVVFGFDPTAGILTNLADFDGAGNGANPQGDLLHANDGNSYGLTSAGGSVGLNNLGVIFKLKPGAQPRKLFDFAGSATGSQPFGSLVQGYDGALYGMTSAGGSTDEGTIFKLEAGLTPLDEPPTVDAPAQFTFTEDVTGNLQFTGSPFADPDDTVLTVVLSVEDGAIEATTADGVTVGGTATARTFVGSVGDLIAFFTTAGKITYTPARDNNDPRTLTTAVSGSVLGASATSAITVTPVNDAPVVDRVGDTGPSFTEGGASVSIAPTLTVTDVDSPSLTGATVGFTAGFAMGQDLLAITSPPSGITASYDSNSGLLTLSGPASVESYQAALRAVTYSNSSGKPSGATRSVEFVVNDGSLESVSQQNSITVTPVNDAPALGAVNVNGTEDTTLTFAAADFTDKFSDPEMSPLASITITSPPATGTLKLSGSALMQNEVIQAADLGSLTYEPALDENGDKTFTVTASDGELPSAPATVTVSLTAVNDPPSFALPVNPVTTLAGVAGSSGSVDGTGAAARFNQPVDVAVDGAGNVYTADTGNHTIRRITSVGVVTTLAGMAGMSGSADGAGAAARFNQPAGMAVDGAGNVYVADKGNHTIRRITPGGDVTTLAGMAGMSGSADGTGAAARFNLPTGMGVDGSGNVYVADWLNHTIRLITPGGDVTTLAGMAGMSGSADGTGAAARFSFPSGVAVDGSGNVYVADTSNHTVRRITPEGEVTTVAGTAGMSGSADGTGEAARFSAPLGLAVDGAGNVYVADWFNHTVRRITAGGVVTTLAGMAGMGGSADGTGAAARFKSPSGVAVDESGNVYVAGDVDHTIRKISGNIVAPEGSGPQTIANHAADISPGPADESGQVVSFTLSNNDNTLFSVQPSISSAGTLTFTPATDADGTATVTVTAMDDGGRANNGGDTSAPQTFAITIIDLNEAPVGEDKTITILEDATYTFSASDFGFTDPNDNPPDSLMSVILTTLPAAGTLSLDGLAVTMAKKSVSAADITEGKLRFTPADDANGDAYASFTFQVQDDGGTDNGGVDLDQSANTLTIHVTPVNDAPSFALPSAGLGIDGKVTTPIGSTAASSEIGSGQVHGVAVQSDGKIVVAGFSSNGSTDDFALARYNPDGSLDTSFGIGTDGKVTTPIGGSHDRGQSVAVQSDGKIVVAGSSSNGSTDDFALARYNPDGSLDTSFGTDGKVTTPIGSSHDRGQSVAVQSDGRIVVAGYSSNDADFDFALARYNPDGSLDTSFGMDGKVTTPIGSNHDQGHSVVVQSDGMIVVAGSSSNGSNDDFALARYNPDGRLDTGFGTDGKVTTPIGSSDDRGQSVAVQSDGKIVVAGYSSNGSGDDFALARYHPDGSLDTHASTVAEAEDSGAFSRTGFATDISDGDPEADQTLTFNVSNDNPGLFSVQPAIDREILDTAANHPGTLTFTPAPGQVGTATVTVTLTDDSSSEDPNVKTSDPQTFAITVVGQPKIAVSIGDDPPQQIMDGAVTTSPANGTQFENVAVGDGMVTHTFTIANNGSVDLVLGSITVSGANDSDFTVTQPESTTVASGTGTTFQVKFAPSAAGARTAIVSIPNNDADKSPFDFAIQGTGLVPNKAPTLEKIDNLFFVIPPDAGQQTVNLTGITDGDGGNQAPLMVIAASDNTLLIPNLTVTYTSPDSTGSLQFTPAAGMTGSANITVTVTDGGPTGGDNVNNFSRMFTVTVTDQPNVAPSFTLAKSWTERTDAGFRIWRSVASSADGSRLVAVVYGGQIYTSTDSGTNWTARGSDRRWRSVASSADGTKLVAVVGDGQIYTSMDSGATWTAREGRRRWQAVASSADGSKLVAVGRGEQIYTSTDSGATWTARRSNRRWRSVASSADGAKLVAGVYRARIYTSTDSGATWTARDNSLRWRAVASSADGIKLVAVLYRDRIKTSTDSGATWTARESRRRWRSVASSADGSKLVAAGEEIYTSTDSGVTWTAQTAAGERNWGSVASSADGTKLVAVSLVGLIYTTDVSFNQTVADGAGPQMVPNLAQNIRPGAESESMQTVTFDVTVPAGQQNLFSTLPAIDSAGRLTYAPAIGASGTATVTVVAMDDGGTAGGGADTSGPQTFTITVFASENVSGSDGMTRDLTGKTLANTSGSAITLSGATVLSGGVGVARGPVTFSGAVTVNNGATLNVMGDQEVTISGPLTANPAGSPLVKTGPGTLVLDGANFGGTITVLEGTVVIKKSNENTCVELGGVAEMQGDGTVNCIISRTGSTISPGTSPGAVTVVADVDWEADSTYAWEINDAAGTEGGDPGWDTLVIGGELSLSGGTGATGDIEEEPINVVLTSLTAGDAAGPMANFDNNTAYSWTIATAAGGIVGFDPATINLDASGISNDLGGGAFAIGVEGGTDLVLSFIPASQNDAPTDLDLSADSVAEGNDFGATVGLLTATDANPGDNHTYTLVEGAGDTDNASFFIDGRRLQALEVFDFEAKSSYSVRVRATDAGGLFVERAFTITVDSPPPTPVEEFFTDEANFSAAERADPGLEATVWGHGADPDGDGLPNFMEFGFGTLPRVADRGGDVPYAVGVERVDGAYHTTVTLRRRNLPDHLAFFVELHDPAGFWLVGPEHVELISTTDVGAGLEEDVFRTTDPITPGLNGRPTGAQMVRVRVRFEP